MEIYQTNRRAKGKSEVTIQRVIDNVAVFAREMGVRYPEQISTSLANLWGERKLADGKARSTLSTYYNSLRSFIAFLDEEHIQHSADPTQIKCTPIYKRKVWLTPAQVRKIIRAADHPIDILIRLMFMTGMRISEAVSVTRDHLINGDNTIFIKAKGGAMRPVFVYPEMHSVLWDLSQDDGHCFHDPYGVRLDRRKAYYYIKKAMRLAGFPRAFPHAIRHGFCTDLLRNGADLIKVSRLMGHRNVAVTQIYAHLITDDIQQTHQQYLSRV